jgi:nitrogen fixation/metabolism regulation signal transduction histidine kinase
VLKRSFEPYVTTKSKGTGLGLAVVKKIADEHRATVRIANLQSGDEPGDAVLCARVSLSFSSFIVAAANASVPGPAPAGPAQADGDTTQVH